MEDPGVRIRGAVGSSDDGGRPRRPPRARRADVGRATRSDRARVLGTMMAVTVVIGLLAVADPTTVRPGWGPVFAASLAAAGVVAGALLLVRRPWTDTALVLVVTLSMVIVALSVLANQDRHAAVLNVVLLLPVNVFAAVYLSRPAVRLTSGVMVACQAALALSATADPLQWLVLIGLPAVAFIGTTEVVLRMRHDLRQALDSVRRQSLTDPLTGLLNRRALEERFQDPSCAAGAVGSVLVLDIDHFKAVNDTYGHATGDEVLRRLARGLVEETRSADVVVRLGGEEFLVLTTATGAAAELFAETVRQRAAVWMAEWAATISIGVAHLPDAVELTAPMLAGAIDAADGCLYRAKREGRNRVVCTIVP